MHTKFISIADFIREISFINKLAVQNLLDYLASSNKFSSMLLCALGAHLIVTKAVAACSFIKVWREDLLLHSHGH